MKKKLYKYIWFLSASVLIITLGFKPSLTQERNAKETKLFKKAMTLADQGNYKDAINIFKVIIDKDPNHLDALFNLGLCFLNTTDGADSALIYFNAGLNILTDEEKESFIGTEFGLSIGKAYQVLLQPLKAIAVYEELIDNTAEDDTTLMKELEHEIQACHNAHFFMQHPIALTVENMGRNVNSMYDDHSPLIAVSEQQLFFTSRRNWINMSLLPDGQYAEKVYTVPLAGKSWENARLLQVFFKQNEHEAAASLSPDGDEMILFRNDEHGKSLYISRFNGKAWSPAEKLPFPINSYYEETHASISADKSTLFFTSDRPGGYGGIDIYLVKKNEAGQWGEPKNLGPEINTEYDEETPMIHYDGKTLYFSSEGHNSMGRLDVFYSQMREDSTWNIPVNLGYPINTPDDDFFFVPTINKSHAYYASSKFADNYGGSDIYHVKFDESAETELAVVEGQINDDLGGNPREMRILVTRTKDNKLMGDYRPNPENGKYMLFLEVGFEYEITEKNKKEESKTAYVNVSTEMSFQNQKNPIVFNQVAMDAPLKQIFNKEIEEFADFAEEQLKQNPQSTVDNTLATNIKTAKENKNKASENKTKLTSNKTTIVESKQPEQFTKKSSDYIDITKKQIISENNTESKLVEERSSLNATPTVTDEKVYSDGYTIQILALKKEPLKDFSFFAKKGMNNIKETKCIDGYTRYTYGVFDGYKSSLKVKREILKSGRFTDIWIRPIKDLEILEKK